MQIFMVYIQSTKGMKKGLPLLVRFASLDIRMRGNGVWNMGCCTELSLQNLMPGAK